MGPEVKCVGPRIRLCGWCGYASVYCVRLIRVCCMLHVDGECMFCFMRGWCAHVFLVCVTCQWCVHVASEELTLNHRHVSTME